MGEIVRCRSSGLLSVVIRLCGDGEWRVPRENEYEEALENRRIDVEKRDVHNVGLK